MQNPRVCIRAPSIQISMLSRGNICGSSTEAIVSHLPRIRTLSAKPSMLHPINFCGCILESAVEHPSYIIQTPVEASFSHLSFILSNLWIIHEASVSNLGQNGLHLGNIYGWSVGASSWHPLTASETHFQWTSNTTSATHSSRTSVRASLNILHCVCGTSANHLWTSATASQHILKEHP